MLEFECFEACGALEFAKIGAIGVVRHMSLQLGQVGELLRANGAGLRKLIHLDIVLYAVTRHQF